MGGCAACDDYSEEYGCAVPDHDCGYPGLFSRVDVAGSIRRGKPEVGDIEVVAQAAPNCRPESVRTVLERLGVRRGAPNKAGAAAPWGTRYYRGLAEIAPGTEAGLDLFVVLPPAEWGVVFAIRTGSADFSHAVVTRLHRWGLQSDQGRIVKVATGETLPCSNESLFFRYARLPWIKPELRDPGMRSRALAGEAVPLYTTAILAPRTRHSEKPAQSYVMMEDLGAAPRLELFARRRREGWETWGNEPITHTIGTLRALPASEASA